MATTKVKPKDKKKVKVKPPPRLSTVRPPAADLDPGKMTLAGKPVGAKLRAAITDTSLEQTIAGASTLTLTVDDWAGGLMNSQLVKGATTLIFDAISFTLIKLDRQDDGTMTLTFEETAVNLLRQYNKPKKANRANTTRAQFVRSMVTEVTQARIPFKCPEVNDKQPIAS